MGTKVVKVSADFLRQVLFDEGSSFILQRKVQEGDFGFAPEDVGKEIFTEIEVIQGMPEQAKLIGVELVTPVPFAEMIQSIHFLFEDESFEGDCDLVVLHEKKDFFVTDLAALAKVRKDEVVSEEDSPLEEISRILESQIGDWDCVDPVYCPAWVLPLKVAKDIADEAIAKEREVEK